MTAKELSAIRRAAAQKSAEARRAKSRNKRPARTITIRADDFDRVSAVADEHGLTIIDAVSYALNHV